MARTNKPRARFYAHKTASEHRLRKRGTAIRRSSRQSLGQTKFYFVDTLSRRMTRPVTKPTLEEAREIIRTVKERLKIQRESEEGQG